MLRRSLSVYEPLTCKVSLSSTQKAGFAESVNSLLGKPVDGSRRKCIMCLVLGLDEQADRVALPFLGDRFDLHVGCCQLPNAEVTKRKWRDGLASLVEVALELLCDKLTMPKAWFCTWLSRPSRPLLHPERRVRSRRPRCTGTTCRSACA